ncbi:MAG TPA: TaqI-like C-terminal specificity domain-containing protein [Bryobacteraceae bacterium]
MDTTLGAFYTPRNVVQYMVDEALIAHFMATVPEPKVRQLLSDQATNPCSPGETEQLIAAIEQTRILDPACGSGAFLMGALHRLVHLLSKLDPNNVAWKRRQLEAAKRDGERAEAMEEAENRESTLANIETRIRDIGASFDTNHHDLDYARKLFLIENSIFGVDIQPIACQIAKLRFFIALLVDQKSEKTLRPLPNLETRLVAADTLIRIENAKDDQMFIGADQVKTLRERLRKVRHEHFNVRTPEAKQRVREKDAAIRTELSEELHRQGMPNTTARRLAGWDPYDQNKHAEFFDPDWMFSPEDHDFSGFDVVIGNPPYVRQEKIKDEKPVLRQLYECFTGTADLYVYFYERGIKLLSEGGVFSFITSNKWMRSGYGEKLRAFLKSNTRVRRFIDFGDAEIFEAIAYPCIVILTRGKPSDGANFRAMTWNSEEWKLEDLTNHLASDMFEMSQCDLAPEAWRLESKTKLKLLDRIKAAGTPLGTYVNNRFYRGILTGLNRAFVVDRPTRDRLIEEHPSSAEVLKPFLRGRDIKRWRVEFEDQYLIRIESSENVDHPWSGRSEAKAEKAFAEAYPAIHASMEPLRKEMIARYDQGKYFWELRACAYWHEFDEPKIIYPDIYEHQSFAWDTQRFYMANTCYFIPTDEQWLIAVLNSQPVEWFYSQVSNKVRGGYMRAFSDYMRTVPIPDAPPARQQTIKQISNAIIALNGQGPTAAYLERLLNALVYELFFPEDLHRQRLHFFDLLAASAPPRTAAQVEWSAFHDRIADVNDPIYAALFALNGLEVVRIIEDRD